jgi:hypothetical protein
MATHVCGACGGDVRTGAAFCPKCGKPIDWSKSRAAPAGPLGVVAGCGIVFVALVLIAGIIAASNSKPGPPPPPPAPDAFSAWFECKSFVEKRLKAPSTADFASFDRQTVESRSDGHFVVSSYVDSQNSFGAKIRTDYACEVHFKDDGARVILDNLQMD